MRNLLLSLFALPALVLAQTPPTVSVAELVKNPAKHDGKRILVAGKVADFKAKVSKKGNPYLTFRIVEGKDSIAVYARGKAPKTMKDGVDVKIPGLFRKEKRLGERVIKNELDASPVEDEKAG